MDIEDVEVDNTEEDDENYHTERSSSLEEATSEDDWGWQPKLAIQMVRLHPTAFDSRPQTTAALSLLGLDRMIKYAECFDQSC